MNPQDVVRTISVTNPQINHLSNVQFDADQGFDSPERIRSFFGNREGTISDISLKKEDDDKPEQLKVIEDDYSDRM